MTEQPVQLVRELRDDLPHVVTLEWEGDDLRFVSVAQDWAEQVGSAELIRQTVRAYQAARPAPTSWRDEVSLEGIPVEQWREFGELVREARESDPIEKHEPIVVRGHHLETTWSYTGGLLRLSDPHCWLVEAPRQAIAEELTEVLQRPETNVVETAAVARLRRFTEGVTTR